MKSAGFPGIIWKLAKFYGSPFASVWLDSSPSPGLSHTCRRSGLSVSSPSTSQRPSPSARRTAPTGPIRLRRSAAGPDATPACPACRACHTAQSRPSPGRRSASGQGAEAARSARFRLLPRPHSARRTAPTGRSRWRRSASGRAATAAASAQTSEQYAVPWMHLASVRLHSLPAWRRPHT